MSYDAGLLAYTNATEHALVANPPASWPAYQADPIGCWRYVMRCYGHGLAIYPERQVRDLVKTLYGRWFVKLEFRSGMPKIDNSVFVGWILDAMQEAK